MEDRKINPTTVIPSGLNILPAGSLYIEKTTYATLVTHCKDKDLNFSNLYLYVDEGDIIAGFSQDIKSHVRLNPTNWKPVYTS